MEVNEREAENRRRLKKAVNETKYKITHEIVDDPMEDSVSELKVQFQLVESSSPNEVLGTLVESVAIDSLGSHLSDVLAEARAQAFARFAVVAEQLQESFPNSVRPLAIALNKGFIKG